MATRLTDEFPSRTKAPTAAYPDGSYMNETSPGANDGTPLDERIGDDYEGLKQGLLDKAGITPNGQPDSVTNPQQIQAIEKFIGDGDSQLAGGAIWPLSSQDSLSLGAQSTVISIDADMFRVNTGLEVEILYLWKSSGMLPASPFTITNIVANSSAGYDFTIGGSDYEFVTSDIRVLRGDNGFPTLQPEAYPEGWGAVIDDPGFDNHDAIQRGLNESPVLLGSVGTYHCLTVDFDIPSQHDFIGANKKSIISCPTAITPFIRKPSGRLFKSKIEGWRFEGNSASEDNHGIFCDTGMRHCEIYGNDFAVLGGDAMRFIGDISGGGAGLYYNKISYNLIGDALQPTVFVQGHGISILGTMNQNEISYNTIRNTLKNGMQFLEVTGNSFMQQNNQVYGNGIEGCGRTDTQIRAGIFLGDLTTNVNIWGNYFERNGSDTDGGADIICNSPTTGIGSAQITFNIFAQSQYNIWVVQYSDLYVVGNWRSGQVANGGIHFLRIDAWNGLIGRDVLHFSNNMTHSTCDIPFMQVNIPDYPVGDYISGEIALLDTDLTPNLNKSSRRNHLMEGVIRMYKTGGDGNVLVFESSGTERGFVEVSGSGVNFGSSSARLGLKADTKELIFDTTLLRTSVDIDTQLGNANFRYITAYFETAPVVGSDEWLKHTIQDIPQELCDLAMETEIKQYHLHSSQNGDNPRFHYGIVINDEFLSKLDSVYGIDKCAALCRDIFETEDGEIIYKELGGVERREVWQLRYDEWQNILLEATRRKINSM